MGYSGEDKKLDPEVLRKHIYGGHVAEYMEEMQEEAPEKYQSHFAKWIEAEVDPEDIEELYKGVRAYCLTSFSSVSTAACTLGNQAQRPLFILAQLEGKT